MDAVLLKAVEWCRSHFAIGSSVGIRIRITAASHKDHHHQCGSCTWNDDDEVYDIAVTAGQSLRDAVATIAHEMVHVMQWETWPEERWDDDGEAEAEALQYELADALWDADAL